MKEKATIYDYARMCVAQNRKCPECKLYNKLRVGYTCVAVLCNQTDEANEIILKWCKEHPVKTRQDKFLEMFPNANIKTEYIDICPRTLNYNYACQNKKNYSGFDCCDCKKSYWLAEVKE